MNNNKNLYAKLIPVMLCFFAMGFVDNGSVELFVDGGRIAMTNLVFRMNLITPYVFIVKEGR